MKSPRFSLSLFSLVALIFFLWTFTLIGCGGGSNHNNTPQANPTPGTPPPGGTGTTGSGTTSGGSTTGGTTAGGTTTGGSTSGGTTTGGTTTGGTTTGGSSGGSGSTGSGTGGTTGGTTGGSGAQTYTLVDLTTRDPNQVGPELPFAINANGDVAGGTANNHAFLYTDGKVSRIPEMSGFTSSSALGMNNAQQVVGSEWFMNGEAAISHAFVYTSSTGMKDINFLNTTSEADGINSAGQIVGWARPAGTNTQHAIIYDNGQTQDLGPGIAKAINDAGTVVGNLSSGSGFRAFVYSNGKTQDLGTFGGPNSAAWAVNARGDVVGFADLDGSHDHAFLFTSNGGMKDLGTLQGPGGVLSRAFGINAAGQIVGTSSFDNVNLHAFLYTDGAMKDLNDLIPADSGVVLTEALAINDSGQITAEGTVNHETHAFVLTPKQ